MEVNGYRRSLDRVPKQIGQKKYIWGCRQQTKWNWRKLVMSVKLSLNVLGFLAKDAFRWPQMLNFSVSSHYFNTGIFTKDNKLIGGIN